MYLTNMNLSVLIADGSAAARENLIAVMPKDWGVTWSEASTGNEALDACNARHPNVMFLDLILPGMPSLEVMETLQRAHASTTVIVMSDEAPADLKSRARAGGAVAFVEKPVCRETLESLLAACGLFDRMDEAQEALQEYPM